MFPVYKELQKKESLSKLKTLVHGDAKIDNFMLKKVYGENDVFSAMLIDWQGCCFDRVTNDLMWCLYGFIKNLPETGEMIHGYVDYSLGKYTKYEFKCGKNQRFEKPPLIMLQKSAVLEGI